MHCRRRGPDERRRQRLPHSARCGWPDNADRKFRRSWSLSFPPVAIASERNRKAVDAVVCWPERSFDELKPAGFVERAPRAGRRARGTDLRDLLDRALFDERTNTVAISHGVSPHLMWTAGDGGWGRGGIFPRRRLESYLCG